MQRFVQSFCTAVCVRNVTDICFSLHPAMEYRLSVVVCALRPAKPIQNMGGALWLAFGLKAKPCTLT